MKPFTHVTTNSRLCMCCPLSQLPASSHPGPFVLEVFLNSSSHVLGKVLSKELTRMAGGSPHVDRRLRQWHSFSVPLRGLSVGATLCTAVLRGEGVAVGGESRQFQLVKAPGERHNKPYIDHRSGERKGGGGEGREGEGGEERGGEGRICMMFAFLEMQSFMC